MGLILHTRIDSTRRGFRIINVIRSWCVVLLFEFIIVFTYGWLPLSMTTSVRSCVLCIYVVVDVVVVVVFFQVRPFRDSPTTRVANAT